jgi:hypothetical protein
MGVDGGGDETTTERSRQEERISREEPDRSHVVDREDARIKGKIRFC